MNNTKNISLCGIFIALIIAGAFIKIPVPVVPFTLQYLFTMLAGLILGKKRGSFCVLVYIFMGLLGLPVFAEGGGIYYIFKPSFGYLIGFAVGAYVTGAIGHGKSDYKTILTANFAGLAVVYIFGMVYYYIISNFYLMSPIGIWPLFLYCFLLAVPGDIALCILACVLAKRLVPVLSIERA
jgi:biotin transport system substrate-specific component